MITREPLKAVLFPLHLFLCFIGVLAGRGLSTCTPSCGNLGNISNPFRVLGDPPHCGRPEYELVCDGNLPILKLIGGKYHVISISYERQQIRVVDERLARSSCSLPSQPLFPESFDSLKPFSFFGGWVAFVTCLSSVTDESYKSLQCMSNESSRVYLVHEDRGYQLRFLKPSCHMLSSIPLTDESLKALSSGENVFKLLAKGFDLHWSARWQFGNCWRPFRGLHLSIHGEGILWTLIGIEFTFLKFFVCQYYSLHLGLPISVLLAVPSLAGIHIIVLSLLGRLIGMPLCIFVALIRKFQQEHAFIDIVEKFLQNQNMLTPARYSYPEIVIITNHFEKKLGQGGFGSVFQGKLPGGYLVAVKMLSDSKFDGEDFINEVSTIGRIHHINVMQLIGYCSEGPRRALVYEYMQNGSLDKYVCPGKQAGPSLSWEKLNEIVLGVARGVEYLHLGCDMCILHFDIKPHNVLLDHDLTPKVSDFGLAKLYPKDRSLVSVSAARGTMGYIAPELVSRNFGPISHKSDVYSFGMLLLEVAGAKNLEAVSGKSGEAYFPDCVYDRLTQERELEEGVDAKMGEIEMTLCIVGLWCIQMNPSDRPSMSRVVEMLEGRTPNLQMPARPFFPSSQNSFAGVSSFVTSSAELAAISE